MVGMNYLEWLLELNGSDMKVYIIIFYIYAILAIYNFAYVIFFQEKTYSCYVREYYSENGTVARQYSIEEDTSNKPGFYELCEVPPIGKYLREFYLKTYPAIILLFIPLLIYGLIILFVKRKYSDYKWWVPQLIGYVCLFCIVMVIINFV